MRSLTTSFISLSLLSGTVHAESIARVWTHFYPNCPGEAFSNLDTYEKYHVSGPSQNITQGSCKSFSVPSYEKNLVDAISVDAELLSNDHDLPFLSGGSGCNITVHEVPECIDPPLISKEIRDGVAISQCASRQFVAYSQVWVNLVCDSDSPLHNENIPTHGAKENNKQADTHQSIPTSQPDAPVRAEKHTTVEDIKNIQMPGSNSDSWRASQATHSQREPVQEGRVNQAGHAQSDQIVHHIMQLLKNKTSHIVTGKHHAHSNVTLHHNGTAPGNSTVMTRRRLSVLRNRAARLV
ncbi:hypothetical protein E8E15_009829 [Penicillium rubens]|jgi:hypothetical protein|uniref:Pc14g00510 protein n=2 Tax=Penicillium chrysogenum species complex TaxID=254878 RepID=B6H5N4_PENRW|nr:uncharacterized protein N7525_000049 [Penicillium rubens]KZN89941.1 hypothetical protein EN45_000470 [Penicillium chrysogenum]CAP74192.1 Pc14g00510 [Penicillium rubens Wisconsin 54-1255]KAF3024671.1 hypothetical protein E8E15_009829 [Penicillium rubens]KAJ5040171.1 hypothetical protein NUH16_009973 [Penicillium rubens]KAJ5842308.1 hypothetical protein N7525_000049 [Penicillium rubens]